MLLPQPRRRPLPHTGLEHTSVDAREKALRSGAGSDVIPSETSPVDERDCEALLPLRRINPARRSREVFLPHPRQSPLSHEGLEDTSVDAREKRLRRRPGPIVISSDASPVHDGCGLALLPLFLINPA
eukprot:138437-Rhodomonas_salina.4